MASPLPIDVRLEAAAQLVLRSRIFYDIWAYFEGADTRLAIIDTMRIYNEFFRFAPHAHFVAFIVQTAALFDRHKGTISLPHLLQEMKTDDLISAQDAAVVDSLISQAKPFTRSIAILRNKAFAHRSDDISYDDVFKMAAVTARQLRELTETALNIANCLLVARGRSEKFFNELPQNDAEATLKALGRIAKASDQHG